MPGKDSADMRIGIFGGTFNPIHTGHLIIAQEVTFQLQLDKTLFIPAGNPPHKQNEELAAAINRKEMVELAIAGNKWFELEPFELNQSEISYTIRTLEYLQGKYAGGAFTLIVGADMVFDLVHWRESLRIAEMLDHIAAVRRPGSSFSTEDMRRLAENLHGYHNKVIAIEAPQIAVSSSMIRSRVRNHEPIHYLVPSGVEAYIRQNHLYSAE